MSERPKYAFIDLLNFIGLNTKSSNEVKQDLSVSESLNTDLFRVYGAVSKCYGSSRVLNAVYSEQNAPRKISWIGAWKNTSLNGQTDRQVLCAAGSKLHRADSGSLTALTGSGKSITETWIEGLYHVADKANDLLFITNRDPDLIGHGNTLVKYDGNEITRWGLRYPSTEPSVTTTIGSVGAAPPVGPNNTWIATNGTATGESVTTQDGNSVSLTKTSTVSTSAYIEQTLATPLIGHTKNANAVDVWVFIPLGQLSKLASTNAVQIKMTSSSQVSSGITIPDFSTNAYVWNVPVGQLFEGWNLVQLGFSTTSTDLAFDDKLQSPVTGSPTIGSLSGVRLGINTVAATDVPSGICFSFLRSYYRGNADVAAGAGGSVFTSASVYSYKITFVSKQGLESNAGPQSTDLTLGSGTATLELTNIPTSLDPQVTSRKIYRTVGGGSVWIFIDSIYDNTTTVYSDTLADSALGSDTPPEAGDNSIDHTPPPPIAICKFWEHTMFGSGDASNPNTVYWSDTDEPEAWPQLNTATLDAKVTAIYEAYSALIVETELGKWQVIGENPDFKFNKIITNIGCIGRRAAGETRLQGWAIDRDGVRIYDANNPSKISEAIRDKFDGFDKTYLELSHSCHSKNNNAIIFAFTGSSQYSFNSDNYVYQYPVDEVGEGWWWQLSLPTSVNILDMEEIEDDNGDFHLYFGGDDGMIYELFARDAKSWATATSSEAVTTRFKTKWLRLGQLGENTDGVSGRVAPRFIEVIMDGDPCTWNVTLETATGPNQATATDSVTVPLVFGDTNEKLMRYPVTFDLQPGEYIRITAEQATINKDSRLLAMRMYFQVKPGQFAIETGAFNANL
jgi:hypothetical protein